MHKLKFLRFYVAHLQNNRDRKEQKSAKVKKKTI